MSILWKNITTQSTSQLAMYLLFLKVLAPNKSKGLSLHFVDELCKILNGLLIVNFITNPIRSAKQNINVESSTKTKQKRH